MEADSGGASVDKKLTLTAANNVWQRLTLDIKAAADGHIGFWFHKSASPWSGIGVIFVDSVGMAEIDPLAP